MSSIQMFHLKLLLIPLPFDRDVIHTKRSLIMHGEATNDIKFSSSLMATCEVIKETQQTADWSTVAATFLNAFYF